MTLNWSELISHLHTLPPFHSPSPPPPHAPQQNCGFIKDPSIEVSPKEVLSNKKERLILEVGIFNVVLVVVRAQHCIVPHHLVADWGRRSRAHPHGVCSSSYHGSWPCSFICHGRSYFILSNFLEKYHLCYI